MTLVRMAGTHARITRRRGSVWFAIVPLTMLGALIAFVSPAAPRTGGMADLAFTGQMIALFSGAAYAAAFTGFFTSRARRSMDEIEASTPVASTTMRAARVVGTIAIVLVPSAAVVVATGIAQTVSGHLAGIPVAVAVVATIVLPSAMIATSLSALAGTLLPQALARVMAVLAWFWGVFSTPLIPLPTLNGTILNIVGDTTTAGLYGGPSLYQPDGPLRLEATPLTAGLSLAWQFALIALLLIVGSALAQVRQQR